MSATTMAGRIITIERFILEEQRATRPDSQGILTGLLYDLALSAKFIANRAARSELTGFLADGSDLVLQPPKAEMLHQFAEMTIHRLNDHTGRLAVMASEEQPHMIPIPQRYETGKYVLLYDPLDGTTNVDFNTSIGTIFAVHQRKSQEGPGTMADLLQPGRDLVAAGYIIYGASTMMVYSAGQGVHGFTLDPSIGEFLLSHPNIQIPDSSKYYSVNQGYTRYWSDSVRKYTEWLQGQHGQAGFLSSRYIGSLVADFHRNLLAGGVFYYPANSQDPELSNGRLRLNYEAAPLAFLAEQAGGYASDGTQPILDIQPTSLHQRTPFFIGNRELVEKAEEFLTDQSTSDA
ncbi:MAG: class 1 fructose-bisphosphatase [Chloroflexota bacterium]